MQRAAKRRQGDGQTDNPRQAECEAGRRYKVRQGNEGGVGEVDRQRRGFHPTGRSLRVPALSFQLST